MKTPLEGVEPHVDLALLQRIRGVESVVAGRADTLSGGALTQNFVITI